ncbi:MAG: peptidoglycan-binding domain-containing protein [Patescibacteria group bacterium]
MNTFSKKLISTALTATTTVWASGALLLFPIANAQTTGDLQAQIAALLAQIQQLQSQLGMQSQSTSYNFTRNLTVGSTGDDVKALQQFLNSHGAQVSATGAGSPGSESTYFGAKTKSALAAYQASVGISPAAGYFGPITKARVNSLAITQGPGPGPGPVVPAPATGLSVSLASDNPAPGSLISSSGAAAARTPVLAVNLTAGTASGVTVSELKFNKIGVLSDSSISGAYVVEDGKVIAQYNSISSGVVAFSGLSLNVAAGQTRKVWLAIDVATGLSAGNTVGFGVSSASNVTAWDASNALIAAAGSFPLNGNTFTVTSVSNPSLATLVTASSSIGSSVTAGTNNNLVGAWSFTVGNSKVKLSSLNFRVIGSATKTDIRNVKLTVNGTQVGNTLAQVDPSGNAYFDMTANPGILNTGANNIQVWADIMGSPSYTFQFEILNSYDILAIDSQYNVPVSPTVVGGVGTQVTILAGTITVSQASNTPTGNIAPGQSGVVLAKFTIYAAGEAVKVKWLGVGLNLTNASSQLTMDSQFSNLVLVDDAGGQVGTTINTLTTSVTCTDTAFANSTSSYRNCFGNSSSPINYIVPANTTRVLSLIADVKSTASFTNVTGILTGNTSNLQGLTSASTASSGSVNGSALTLAATSLTLARNSSIGTVTQSGGASNRRIGSYAFTASSAEGVRINNLNIQSNGNNVWNNLKVMVGSAQFGTTQGSVASGTVYSFSGTPFTVAAGATTYVDIYADTISGSTGTINPATIVTGCSASGLVSLTSISCSSTNGQAIVFAGQPTITVSADSGQAPSDQLVMGSAGNSLATFRFTETSNVEDVKITDLNVFQSSGTSTVKAAFGNLSLYSGSTLVGTAGSANTSANTHANASTSATGAAGYYYQFHFATPVVVPQANSLLLVLKGDVSSYSSSGATDNTTHVFRIATSTDSVNDAVADVVVALGSTSNASSAITLSSANSNTMTALRSNIVFSSAPLGVASGRAKSASDNLATLTFAASSAGDVAINSVVVQFAGTAPSIVTFLDGVSLLDENGNTLGTANTTSSVCDPGVSACTKTFNLGVTTAGQTISKSTSRTWTLRIDSTATKAATASIAQTLTATINAITSIRFTDALDGAASTALSLPSKVVVPINLNSVTFSVGT